MTLTWAETKKLADEHINQMIKDLVSVQPMGEAARPLLEACKEAQTEEQLRRDGYEPVSHLGLLWIKKDKK